jgi:hypothetical protein
MADFHVETDSLIKVRVPVVKCTNHVLIGSFILTLYAQVLNLKIEHKYCFLLSNFNSL